MTTTCMVFPAHERYMREATQLNVVLGRVDLGIWWIGTLKIFLIRLIAPVLKEPGGREKESAGVLQILRLRLFGLV
jgi:hypothetical protein